MLVVDFGYRHYASRRIRGIIENVPTFAAVPTPPVPEHDVLSITTEDGVVLEACIHWPDAPAIGVVVFCPELHGNHWTALHYGNALINAGFVLVAFDFRNQGNSQTCSQYQPIHWVTEHELTDIRAVLNYVRTSPDLNRLSIGIFGVSRGASAALLAACRHPEIRAVVTDSGYSTMSLIRHFMHKFSRFVVPDWFFNRLPKWHIELVLRQTLARSQKARACCYLHLEAEASTLPSETATLLISGGRDSYVTPDVSREVAGTIRRPDAVCIVEKARHNKSRDRSPDTYDRQLVDHFRASLSPEIRSGDLALDVPPPTEVAWQPG